MDKDELLKQEKPQADLFLDEYTWLVLIKKEILDNTFDTSPLDQIVEGWNWLKILVDAHVVNDVGDWYADQLTKQSPMIHMMVPDSPYDHIAVQPRHAQPQTSPFVFKLHIQLH